MILGLVICIWISPSCVLWCHNFRFPGNFGYHFFSFFFVQHLWQHLLPSFALDYYRIKSRSCCRFLRGLGLGLLLLLFFSVKQFLIHFQEGCVINLSDYGVEWHFLLDIIYKVTLGTCQLVGTRYLQLRNLKVSKLLKFIFSVKSHQKTKKCFFSLFVN